MGNTASGANDRINHQFQSQSQSQSQSQVEHRIIAVPGGPNLQSPVAASSKNNDTATTPHSLPNADGHANGLGAPPLELQEYSHSYSEHAIDLDIPISERDEEEHEERSPPRSKSTSPKGGGGLKRLHRPKKSRYSNDPEGFAVEMTEISPPVDRQSLDEAKSRPMDDSKDDLYIEQESKEIVPPQYSPVPYDTSEGSLEGQPNNNSSNPNFNDFPDPIKPHAFKPMSSNFVPPTLKSTRIQIHQVNHPIVSSAPNTTASSRNNSLLPVIDNPLQPRGSITTDNATANKSPLSPNTAPMSTATDTQSNSSSPPTVTMDSTNSSVPAATASQSKSIFSVLFGCFACAQRPPSHSDPISASPVAARTNSENKSNEAHMKPEENLNISFNAAAKPAPPLPAALPFAPANFPLSISPQEQSAIVMMQSVPISKELKAPQLCGPIGSWLTSVSSLEFFSGFLQPAKHSHENVVASIRQQRSSFIDPQFPPNSESLFGPHEPRFPEYCIPAPSSTGYPAEQVAQIRKPQVFNWLKPAQMSKSILNRSSKWCVSQLPIQYKNHKHSEVGLCNSLAVLTSLMSTFPQLIDRVIVSPYSDDGVYTVSLFYNSKWHALHIDDSFPALDSIPQFAFAASSNGELWPALCEKALAKFYGSYKALEKVPVHHLWSDLCGAPAFSLSLRPGFHTIQSSTSNAAPILFNAHNSGDDLFNHLLLYHSCQFVLLAKLVDNSRLTRPKFNSSVIPTSYYLILAVHQDNNAQQRRLLVAPSHSHFLGTDEPNTTFGQLFSAVKQKAMSLIDEPTEESYWLPWQECIQIFEEISVCAYQRESFDCHMQNVFSPSTTLIEAQQKTNSINSPKSSSSPSSRVGLSMQASPTSFSSPLCASSFYLIETSYSSTCWITIRQTVLPSLSSGTTSSNALYAPVGIYVLESIQPVFSAILTSEALPNKNAALANGAASEYFTFNSSYYRLHAYATAYADRQRSICCSFSPSHHYIILFDSHFVSITNIAFSVSLQSTRPFRLRSFPFSSNALQFARTSLPPSGTITSISWHVPMQIREILPQSFLHIYAHPKGIAYVFVNSHSTNCLHLQWDLSSSQHIICSRSDLRGCDVVPACHEQLVVVALSLYPNVSSPTSSQMSSLVSRVHLSYQAKYDRTSTISLFSVPRSHQPALNTNDLDFHTPRFLPVRNNRTS